MIIMLMIETEILSFTESETTEFATEKRLERFAENKRQKKICDK